MTKPILNTSILNIFKHEKMDDFIAHHAPLVDKLIMLNTGDAEMFNQAVTIAKGFDNVEVYFQEFEHVDFSKFRNACLVLAKERSNSEYFLWVDSDERLELSGSVKFTGDIITLAREDGSKRFTSFIARAYKASIPGVWTKSVHEHFTVSTVPLQIQANSEMRIKHLTSEVLRPKEKKELYFSLLKEELAAAESSKNRQRLIDAIQHLLLMASHDFKNSQLCVDMYVKYRAIINSMDTSFEISKIQKLNMLIHSLMSFSRLGYSANDQECAELINSINTLDNSKSTYFQLMRALVFSPTNVETVKEMYENVFLTKEAPSLEFDNQDYKSPKEIAWLEKKIYVK